MLLTIQNLLNSNEKLFDYYARAREKWSYLLREYGGASVIQFAEELTNEEPWFVEHCGGDLGREIMPISGIIGQYQRLLAAPESPEELRKLLLIHDSLASSYCSLIVKSETEQLSIICNLPALEKPSKGIGLFWPAPLSELTTALEHQREVLTNE